MNIENNSRNGSGREGSPLSSPLLYGVSSGILHAIVAVSLWRFFGFESLRGMLSTEPLLLTYTLVGMFALGFIPGYLYVAWGPVFPGLLLVGLLGLSGYGTWMTIEGDATPVDPTAFGWYILLWVGVAVLVLGVGWIEMRFRA